MGGCPMARATEAMAQSWVGWLMVAEIQPDQWRFPWLENILETRRWSSLTQISMLKAMGKITWATFIDQTRCSSGHGDKPLAGRYALRWAT